ncbi:MAG: hypothetical protein ACRDD1_06410, partial [Planctomycetia bacterium]
VWLYRRRLRVSNVGEGKSIVGRTAGPPPNGAGTNPSAISCVVDEIHRVLGKGPAASREDCARCAAAGVKALADAWNLPPGRRTAADLSTVDTASTVDDWTTLDRLRFDRSTSLTPVDAEKFRIVLRRLADRLRNEIDPH